MIIFIRNMMHKGNIYKIFLWVFLLMFIGGGFGLSRMGGRKPFAIRVYGEKISSERYQSTVEKMRQVQEYYRSLGLNMGERNVEKTAVTSLVNSALERHLLGAMGVHVDAAILKKRIDEQLASLPAEYFDKNGRLDQARFEKTIGDVDAFVESVELEIKRELLNNVIDLSRYSSQFEVQAQYNKEYGNKKIEVLSITATKFVEQARASAVSDDQLAAFYKNIDNRDAYKTKEERSADYWSFDRESYDISVSDKELKKEYDRVKNEKYFVSAAEVQVRKIFLKSSDTDAAEVKTRLKGLRDQVMADPKTFADVAKKASEDKATAAAGGLMPFFKKDSRDHDVVIVKKAFESLVEDGQISDLLKVTDGYAIIQRVARKKATYKAFDSVKRELHAELFKKKFEQRFMQDAQRAVSAAKYKPEGLQAFIEKHHGDKKTVALSTREASLIHTRLFQTDLLKHTAFIDEKGNGVILCCTQIVPAALKPLAEVRGKIQDAYYMAEGKRYMRAAIDEIFAETATKSFAEIARERGLKYEEAETTYVDGERKDSAILKNPDVQQKMGQLQYTGDVLEVELAHTNLLLKLARLDEPNPELFAEKKQDMMQTLYYAEQYQKQESFIASLSKNAIIKSEIEIKAELKFKADSL